MLWSALEDTGLTNGAALDTWRKEQNPKANAGTNFKDNILPEKPELHDLPALIMRNEDVDLPEYLQNHAASDRVFTVALVGVLRVPEHREAAGDKLIMRFQHLVESTLGEARNDLIVANSSYLPSGVTTNPLSWIYPGNPVFPDFAEENVPPQFWWPVHIQIKFGSIWPG